MKQILSLVAIFLALTLSAQIIQPGIVQEYNEKAKKTPLAGVELRAKSATSAASGKDGKFELEFLTLNPGDRVVVSRIEKLGYEIFNKEAVEQWNINPKTPFVVIMCKSDKFKKIRDNYESKASENYNKQYKKEIATLNKLMEEGKIKEEEYRKSLQEIQTSYDKQLENLDNYVDRFARIDLSELSSQEQEIIELVQQGQFEEAIAKYENLNIVGKLKEGIKKKNEAKAAKDQLAQIELSFAESNDSLYTMAQRQIKTLLLAGFQQNIQRIKDIYIEIADADSTNVNWVLITGRFIEEYIADLSLAMEYYKKALRNAIIQYGPEHCRVADLYNNIGGVYASQGDYSRAHAWYKKALAIREKVLGTDHQNLAASFNNIGWVYYSQGDFTSALDCYMKALAILEKVNGSEHPNAARYYNNIGLVYDSLGEYSSALSWYMQALAIHEKVFNTVHPDLGRYYNNIGLVYDSLGDYSTALEWLKKSLAVLVKIFGAEHPDVATSYHNLGSVYDSEGDYSTAIDFYKKALEISEKVLGTDHPDVANIYHNIGGVYYSQKDYSSSIEWYMKALSIKEKFFLGEHPDMATYYNNIGLVYYSLGDYLCAIDWYNKALTILEKVFGTEYPEVATTYAEIIQCFYSLTKEDDKYIAELNEFLSDKAWTATVVEGDTPASNVGMSGQYYVLEFGDWSYNNPESLLKKNEELKGQPKDIVVMKDCKISRHHFEDKIGVLFGIKKVGKEEAQKAKDLYQQWKASSSI